LSLDVLGAEEFVMLADTHFLPVCSLVVRPIRATAKRLVIASRGLPPVYLNYLRKRQYRDATVVQSNVDRFVCRL